MKHRILLIGCSAFLFFEIPTLALHAASLGANSLQCEGVVDPLGIDVPQPGLGWRLDSNARGERQTAFHVLASSSIELLARNEGDLWDSGKVRSDETLGVSYAGKPLASAQQVFWKVRVWDKAGQVSAWSAPGTWTMGLLKTDDWGKARWIGNSEAVTKSNLPDGKESPGLLLRREFAVKEGLKRAVLNVSGLGSYTFTINGRKGSDDLLQPGWTAYRKTVLYQTYDVTNLLKTTLPNTLRISLGHSIYDITNAPDNRYVKFRQSFGALRAIAQLRLEYADGSLHRIETDRSWQSAESPITFENFFAGEDYDARVQPHWKEAAITEGPGGELRGLSCASPPVRRHEVLQPVKVTTVKPGVTIYDLGQNTSLMPRLVAHGPAGSSVRIIPSELLGKDGLADRASCTQDGVRPAWWQYTLKGAGSESWFPEFFYQGSRYFQVELSPAEEGGPLPSVDKLEGVVVHAASPSIGEFSCSSELFNRTWALVRWAQRSNMMSFMTDCPHREKLGWLEQTHLNGPSLRYNFDMAQLFSKQVNDMADSQLENGFVPNIAPEYFMAQSGIHEPFRNSPEWGGAFIMVPWQQYQFTGDTALLRRHYPAMKRYVAFLDSTAQDNIVSTGLGDWYDLGPKPPWGSQLTPPALTATAFFFYYHWVLGRTAELLGKSDEAAEFDRRAASIRSAFNARFFNPKTGAYATSSQTANAIPLVMDLAEPEDRPRLLGAIVEDIRARDNALTSGDVGYRYLLSALADNGRSDVIFDMNNHSDKPGYGMQLARGATSLTEKWDASVGKFGSQNHFMLGQINEWFFHDLAGIQAGDPGFKKIVIKPAIVGDLTEVKASYDSVRGKIVSRWKREADNLTLSVTIPPNTTATIHMPTTAPDSVRENGQPLHFAVGVTALHAGNDSVVFDVASGAYLFSAQLAQLPRPDFSSR